jgi:NADH:ubiquinone oxidoreductase subunit 5 (subunit L)/multisubunit Na+/H+ antiporter MnhA subunit
MTAPLMVLAVFAVSLGWAGIPEHFPVIGGLIPNWVHHFVGSTIEAGHTEHAARVTGHLAEASHGFVWQPLVMSIVLAVGGLTLGWLVYGRSPLKAGQADPVEARMRRMRLGWLYEAMRKRFYFDELYQALFVRPSIWLADLFDLFDYGQAKKTEDGREVERHGVVDGLVTSAGKIGKTVSDISGWLDANAVDRLVNLAGRFGRAVSWVSGWLDVNIVDGLVNLAGHAGRLASTGLDIFDLRVVDGAVDGVGGVTRAGGRAIRPIQTGRIQDYLLLASLAVLALIVTFFAILFLQI